MTRLINIALDKAREDGMERFIVEFESADMEGRDFWMRNFIPSSWLMTRRIDEREH